MEFNWCEKIKLGKELKNGLIVIMACIGKNGGCGMSRLTSGCSHMPIGV